LNHQTQQTGIAAAASIAMEPIVKRSARSGNSKKQDNADQPCGHSHLAQTPDAGLKPSHNPPTLT
jgi:hypothetical protein